MADDRPFRDKARDPTAVAVTKVLGDAARYYDGLIATVQAFTHEWNHSKTSGWMLKVHDRKKALFYVVPLEGSFRVSLTVRPEERERLLNDRTIAALHAHLREAKKYVEGYALQLLVDNPASARMVTRLVERIATVRRPSTPSH
jgi:hypothetical protein